MKNSADQGGCYPQRPKAEVDNTLRDPLNDVFFLVRRGVRIEKNFTRVLSLHGREHAS